MRDHIEPFVYPPSASTSSASSLENTDHPPFSDVDPTGPPSNVAKMSEDEDPDLPSPTEDEEDADACSDTIYRNITAAQVLPLYRRANSRSIEKMSSDAAALLWEQDDAADELAAAPGAQRKGTKGRQDAGLGKKRRALRALGSRLAQGAIQGAVTMVPGVKKAQDTSSSSTDAKEKRSGPLGVKDPGAATGSRSNNSSTSDGPGLQQVAAYDPFRASLQSSSQVNSTPIKSSMRSPGLQPAVLTATGASARFNAADGQLRHQAEGVVPHSLSPLSRAKSPRERVASSFPRDDFNYVAPGGVQRTNLKSNSSAPRQRLGQGPLDRRSQREMLTPWTPTGREAAGPSILTESSAGGAQVGTTSARYTWDSTATRSRSNGKSYHRTSADFSTGAGSTSMRYCDRPALTSPFEESSPGVLHFDSESCEVFQSQSMESDADVPLARPIHICLTPTTEVAAKQSNDCSGQGSRRGSRSTQQHCRSPDPAAGSPDTIEFDDGNFSDDGLFERSKTMNRASKSDSTLSPEECRDGSIEMLRTLTLQRGEFQDEEAKRRGAKARGAKPMPDVPSLDSFRTPARLEGQSGQRGRSTTGSLRMTEGERVLRKGAKTASSRDRPGSTQLDKELAPPTVGTAKGPARTAGRRNGPSLNRSLAFLSRA